ncbi:MAG: hypothetical protein E4H03_11875 [Myxococcales bacterium]|nr:MAG: hypothetical protein E4H03_11875 [Myxococcales bacterium]
MTQRKLASLLTSLYMTLGFAAASVAGQGDCGQPVSTGASPVSTDALFALRAAVAIVACAPALCDADGDCTVSASDALRILKKAVGEAIELDCGAQCQVTTSSSSSSSSMFGSTSSTTSSTMMLVFASTTTSTTATTTVTTSTTAPAQAPTEAAGAAVR